MEKQSKSPNIDNFSESDEKSSSRSIPRHVLETSVEQASPSWIDYVSFENEEAVDRCMEHFVNLNGKQI